MQFYAIVALSKSLSFKITKTVKEANYLLLTTSPKISLCDQCFSVFFMRLNRKNRIEKTEHNGIE